MQDKDTGKYFKEKLEDYSSPVDTDSLFDAIEHAIEPPKKNERRPVFWLMGCLPVLAILGGLSYFLIINKSNDQSVDLYSENQDHTDQTRPNQNVYEEEDYQNIKIESTASSQKISLNKEHEVNNTNRNIEKQLESSLTPQTPLKHQIESNNTTTQYYKPTILNLVKKISEQQVYAKENQDKRYDTKTNSTSLFSMNQINTRAYFLKWDNRELNLALYQDLELAREENDKRKWEIGLYAAYFNTYKQNSYSSTLSRNWFDEYIGDEKTYGGAGLGLDIKHEIKNDWFFSSNFEYSHTQEGNSYEQLDRYSTFDETLPDTIFVDRELVGFDTIYGQEVMTIDSVFSNLITDVKLFSVGFGIGKKISFSDKISLSPNVQLHTYLIKKIKWESSEPIRRIN